MICRLIFDPVAQLTRWRITPRPTLARLIVTRQPHRDLSTEVLKEIEDKLTAAEDQLKHMDGRALQSLVKPSRTRLHMAR